jgi:prepilin-type N-terminal cleavage/methylation domain-containing protein
MKPSRARRAFTLIELLVALVVMGVAVAGLVCALTGDRRLRDLSAAHSFAADRTRERLELLASLPCTSNASGTSESAWGSERWRASWSQSAWSLTDSLIMLHPSSVPIVIDARVACPD